MKILNYKWLWISFSSSLPKEEEGYVGKPAQGAALLCRVQGLHENWREKNKPLLPPHQLPLQIQRSYLDLYNKVVCFFHRGERKGEPELPGIGTIRSFLNEMTPWLSFERLQQRAESFYKNSKLLNSHFLNGILCQVWPLFGSVLFVYLKIITEDTLNIRMEL